VDEWALNQPFPRAMRTSRQLVWDLLLRTQDEFDGEMHVVSLGCGPAAEVFDLADLDNVRFTLVDGDADAVTGLKAKIRAARMESRVTAMRESVIKMALDDQTRFVYPPSVIYSLRTLDHFTDELAVRLLDYCHGALAPGGVAFLGNVRAGHPNAALFDRALNWPLVLRSKDDLLRLVQCSKFTGCEVAIGADQEGVQLFVECRKPF
jgi:cyclopropane fatty-acyl-phospholipid synthase-like methyltransferase